MFQGQNRVAWIIESRPPADCHESGCHLRSAGVRSTTSMAEVEGQRTTAQTGKSWKPDQAESLSFSREARVCDQDCASFVLLEALQAVIKVAQGS